VKKPKKKPVNKPAEAPVTPVPESSASGEEALHWVGRPEDGNPPSTWTHPALIVLTVGGKLLSESEWKAEMKKIGEMCRQCKSPVPPMALVCKDFAAYEQLRGYEKTPAGPFGAPYIFAAMGKDESITNNWVLPAGKSITMPGPPIKRPEVHEFITRLGSVTTMLGCQLPPELILYHDLLDRYNPYENRLADTCVWEWRMAPTKAGNQATLGITALSKASDFALFLAGPASIKKSPSNEIDEQLANASKMCNAACYDSYTSPHGDLLRAIIALHCKSTSSCFDRSVMTPDDRVEEKDGETMLLDAKMPLTRKACSRPRPSKGMCWCVSTSAASCSKIPS
jgi:hypothetical protein